MSTITLAADLWAIDEGNMSGNLARLFFRSATRNTKGIVEIGDLKVSQTSVASGNVQVGDGAAVLRGAEVLWQGSYWAYNLGSENVAIQPTAGSARKDLLWLRIEDPSFVGSPWSHDASTDVCASFVVTQDVPAGTNEVPSGYTGIALARIEIPASTSNITDAMIVDLRKMADPRTHTEMFSLNGIWENVDAVGNTLEYEEFPNGAAFDVDIPDWASQAVVQFTIYGLQYLKSGGNGTGSNYDAQGWLRIHFGTLNTDSVRYWVRDETSEYTRISYGTGDTLDIPAAMRGTTQTLQLQGRGLENYRGSLEVDGGAGLVVSVLFREVAVHDEPDRSPK